MPLNTVTDYLTKARELLQDQQVPYRYTDAELKGSLGIAMIEARRLRPDLFPHGVIQDVDAGTAPGTAVAMDPQYRMQLVYYMLGDARLRDTEDGAEALAGAFKKTFSQQLLSLI